MTIEDYPIINKVAQSQEVIRLFTNEQTLFAITCVLTRAREIATSPKDKAIIQDMINECCNAIELTNPGFIESLKSMYRIKKQRIRLTRAKNKNHPPRDRRRYRR